MSEDSVVVDIQRSDPEIVYFSQIRDQLPESAKAEGCSKVILGIDVYNQLQFADLSDPLNAHMLVAGKAGSGKSEWLRAVLAGFLLTNTPDNLRLVLIDPKRNAFNELKGSPFLLTPHALIYPDEMSAANVLSKLAKEMDRRHRILQNAGVDTLDTLSQKKGKKIPRIVCMCDEYFDLINQTSGSRKSLEAQIFRLGTKSRTAGIHLIIATQQPSRQVIKGALDANIPARVGFKMDKAIESNMLLNQKGAENLLGLGDLLFKDIGQPIRLQAPYLVPEQRIELFQKR
jgi:DNA segregation ATPase FtsK/SpoIIIE-like protein